MTTSPESVCEHALFQLSVRRLWATMAVIGVVSLGAASLGAQRSAAPAAPTSDLRQVAAGLDKLFIHDECTGGNTQQPDTCLHARVHEKSVLLGGTPGTVYDITLRIRGLFEPTTIEGGETPDPRRPFFVVGGTNRTTDYSRWHIEVSEPKQTYTLNHYPKVSHTIYKEDFEATIPAAAGATVVVRTIDSNDRQIDNGAQGRPDRMQIIEGVVDTPTAGQFLRLDVVRVAAR